MTADQYSEREGQGAPQERLSGVQGSIRGWICRGGGSQKVTSFVNKEQLTGNKRTPWSSL